MRPSVCALVVVALALVLANALDEEEATNRGRALLAAALRVKFEGGEHRSICAKAAGDMKLSAVSSPNKIKLKKLTCVKANEWTTDEIEVEVHYDDKSEILKKDFKKKGDSWDFDGGKEFTFSNSFSITVYEVDRGRSASIDQDDILGTWDVRRGALGSQMSHRFDEDGIYDMEAEGTPGADNPAAKDVPLASLKLLHGSGGDFQLTYDNICAMAGDFFAGSDPRANSISFDVAGNKFRTEAEMIEMFEKVFSWFWDEVEVHPLHVQNLMKQFDLEDQAIARHVGHPDVSVNFAYSEQDSPYGGTTLRHVTNSHNNNFARVMLDLDPDITYYMTVIGQGLDTKKYSRKMRSPFWVNANYNFDHFMEGKANEIYRIGHEIAIGYAVAASQASAADKDRLWRKALAADAFATHFGADTFAAGHQRCLRVKMFQDRTSKNFGGGCDDSNDGEYVAAEGAGAAAAFWHDEDGDVGLIVANKHGSQWRAYGDRQYNHRGHVEGRKQVQKFIQASIDEVVEAFRGTCDLPSGFKSTPKTVAKCLDWMRGRKDNAVGFLPDVKLVESKLNHPPLYRQESNGQWSYRTSWFDEPASYTTNWDCDNIVFGQWNVQDRFNRRNEVNARVRQEELTLTQTYFQSMDIDDDKQVTLVEFGKWFHESAIPIWPMSPIKSQVAISLFKVIGDSKETLSLPDLQRLLISKTSGQTDDLMHVMEFIVAAFLNFININPSLKILLRGLGITVPGTPADTVGGHAAETVVARASARASSSSPSIASRVAGAVRTGINTARNAVSSLVNRFRFARKSKSVFDALNPAGGGEGANAGANAGGACFVLGVDMCFVRDQVMKAVKSTVDIKSLTSQQIAQQLQTLLKLKILPDGAKLDDMSKLVVKEQNKNAFRYLTRRVERRDKITRTMPDYESMYWYAMTVVNDADKMSTLKPLFKRDHDEETQREVAELLKAATNARTRDADGRARDSAMATDDTPDLTGKDTIKSIGEKALRNIRRVNCDTRLGPNLLTPCIGPSGLKPGEAFASNDRPRNDRPRSSSA